MTSKIEWTDERWNPIVGCSRVSKGCEHCYAERIAHRGMTEAHRGLTVLGKKGPRWNGTVRCLPERLAEPLRRRKPRMVFVNSMSDLFHEQVPFKFVAAVFGVMAACPQHTFQVLTKRPERALAFFGWLDERAEQSATVYPDPLKWKRGMVMQRAALHSGAPVHIVEDSNWPLPNVWLGVSVEDQTTADERIPVLLECPAAVRWVSAEPLLSSTDLSRWLGYSEDWSRWVGPCGCERRRDPWTRCDLCEERGWVPTPCSGVNWVVIGGESGPGARPFDLAWARSTIEQCRVANVPCFVKQMGARPRYRVDSEMGEALPSIDLALRNRKGGDTSEWPEDLRVREYPGEAA